nr:M13 family metallopeptidase [Alteromonas sp. ASW11-130]
MLALSGCSQYQITSVKSPTNQEKKVAHKRVERHSGIITANMDHSVKPGDDFHAFVNGAWLKSNEIPADKSKFGISDKLREESDEKVKAIIESSASGNFAKGSDEQKVGDFYHSYVNWEKRNSLGIKPLKWEFDKIDTISNRDELAVHFAAVNKLGYGLPFYLQQSVDFKDPNSYMMFTWQSGLGLPEREFYFSEGEQPELIRTKYKRFMNEMLSLAGIEEPQRTAEALYLLEERIAQAHMKKEDTRNIAALYNKIPTSELNTIMSDFDWSGYLKEAGVPNIDSVVITQLDYMKSLNEIIKDTSLDTWKDYLKWGVVRNMADFLSEEFSNKNFEFYSKTLYGVEEQLPTWRRGVNTVNSKLGEMVGKVFVKKHFSPEAKQGMETVVSNLLKAYKASITELDWMSDKTKAEALDKLSKFTYKIGYPDKWRDYSSLKVERDDLFGNMRRANLMSYSQRIEKLNGPVRKHEWAITPQMVDAYYNPPLNEIVFPAGILQPPYYDINAEDAVNYGAIGAIIGHEIGHGFDDLGSRFDGNGVMRNWWTDEDKAEFKRRTSELVGQYNAFKPFADVNVNGEYTLGENIGDLGGLSISLKAYNMSLEGKASPVMDGYTGVQRVFLGYAQAWLSKSRDEALRQQIKTDTHSPAIYRVNGVVRNIPEFYSAFNVKSGDQLYLPASKRVKIW